MPQPKCTGYPDGAPVVEDDDSHHLDDSQRQSGDGFYVERHLILDGKHDPYLMMYSSTTIHRNAM